MLGLQLVSPDPQDLLMAMLGDGKPDQEKAQKKSRTLFSQPSLHQLAGKARPGDGTGLAAHRLLKQMRSGRGAG